MNFTDYVVSEENRGERIKITASFPKLGRYAYSKNEAPTFSQIFDKFTEDFEGPYEQAYIQKVTGENYDDEFTNVEITVQTEKEGHRYSCNFRDRVFELIEDCDVLTLAEEREKREEYQKKYAVAKKAFRLKQTTKLVAMFLLAGTWSFAFLVNEEFAQKTVFLLLACVLLTGIEMIFTGMRFEDDMW